MTKLKKKNNNKFLLGLILQVQKYKEHSSDN